MTNAAFANPPDWARLEQLGDELQVLVDDGKFTKDDFERLMAEGEKACNGHPEFLEFICNEAQEDWL